MGGIGAVGRDVTVRVTLPVPREDLDDLDEVLAAVEACLGPLRLELARDDLGRVVLVFGQSGDDLWIVVLQVMNAVTAGGYSPVHIAAGRDHQAAGLESSTR